MRDPVQGIEPYHLTGRTDDGKNNDFVFHTHPIYVDPGMNSGADLIYQLTQALYIEGSLFFVLFIRQVTVVTCCLQMVHLLNLILK